MATHESIKLGAPDDCYICGDPMSHHTLERDWDESARKWENSLLCPRDLDVPDGPIGFITSK